jgi:hypothetical protein
MRDRQEVLEKFRELSVRYLRERKEQFLGRLPINCEHNVRLLVKGKGKIGLCRNPVILSKGAPTKWFACNDENTACRCKVFSCKNTEESVEQDFNAILESPSRCGNDYPKLGVLIWFLQDLKENGRGSRLSGLAMRALRSIWGIVTLRWW